MNRRLRAFRALLISIGMLALLAGSLVSSRLTPSAQAAGTICTLASNDLGGVVFQDFNADGMLGPNELGYNNSLGAVTITAYDVDNHVVLSTTSSITGTYNFPNIFATHAAIRLEFSGIPAPFQPSAHGTTPGAATTVQRQISGSCAANLAINVPAEYCQNNPDLCTSTYIPGAQQGNERVLDRMPYLSSGNIQATAISRGAANQVGTTWGLAYQPASQSLFSAAFMKRHAGFGPGGSGQIYRTNAAGVVTPFAVIPNTGTDPHPTSQAPDGLGQCHSTAGPTYTPIGILGTTGCYFHDPYSFDKVGKIGLGDMDIALDPSNSANDRLFVVNLNDRQLYQVGNLAGVPTVSAAAMPLTLPGATQGCALADARPFGLTIWRGVGYAGLVCSAQTTQNTAQLRAYVYTFNLATMVFGSAPLAEFPLTYTRGFADDPLNANWHPWISAFTSVPPSQIANINESVYSQPMLSGLAFDSAGNLTIGLRDRYGDQTGNQSGSTDTNDGNTYLGIAGGDILKVCVLAGVYQLENNGVCGGSTSFGNPGGLGPDSIQSQPQGPGGNEFYAADALMDPPGFQVFFHEELALGGITYMPGLNEVATTVFDPIDGPPVYTGGVRRFQVADGRQSGVFQLYKGQFPDYFGKANGLGDLELLCDAAPLEIGNYVWRDNDGDGIQDPAEPPMPGVAVTLYNSAGTQIASTTTDGNGEYYFNNSNVPGGLLPNTSYSVRIDTSQAPLSGLSPTLLNYNGNAANGDLNDSDGNTAPNPGFVTAPVTTGAAGHNDHTNDFGFVPTFSLGNRVWLDTDNDGQIDGGEVGMNGITVSLFADANADGVPDSPIALATTTTANGGYYRFDTLLASTYLARVNALNFATGGLLASYTSSTPSDATPNNNQDSDDNGIDSAAPATNGILSGPITLGPTAAEPTGETDLSPSGQGTIDAQANMTVDFGFYRLSVGNQLWVDANNNGVLDVGETGTQFANVRVELYDGPTLVAVATTDATGAYLFDRLTDTNGVPNGLGLTPSSSYKVTIPAAEFAPGQPLGSYFNSSGVTSAVDSRDNGVDDLAFPSNGISSAIFSLQPGAVSGGASFTNATGTTDNPTLDFGFYTLSLGDQVFYDATNNGVFDGSDSGIVGVTVNLYRDSNNDGVADGAAIATQATTANGYYLFTGLDADTYIVEIVPPAGYISSTGTNGSATGPFEPAADADSNPTDNDDNGTTSGGVIRSAPVTLTVGGEPTGEPATPGHSNPATDANSNLTVDFGVFRPLSLGNLVWADTNNDGLSNGESGITGVTVELYTDTNGNGSYDAGVDALVGSTTTNASGNYLFTNLIPGDYLVVLPTSNFAAGGALEDLVSSTGTNGSATGTYEPAPNPNTNVDNDDNGTTTSAGVVSAAVTLSLAGEPAIGVDGDDTYGNLTVDFGLFEPASLGDRVWYDTVTTNGVQDAGELGVAGVSVTLHDATTNALIATTTTDASGNYLFDHLIPGSYYVIFSGLPVGYEFVTPDLGGDDALDSDANGMTGRTGDYTLAAGDHNPTVDAGIVVANSLHLGNLVWADYNDNGLVDTGEPGVAGVTVELRDATGTTLLATTTTDSNGNYLFIGLSAGDYVVRIPASQFAAGGPLEHWSSSSAGGTYEPAPDADNNIDNDDNGSTTVNGVESAPITLSQAGEPGAAVDGDDTNGNLTVDFGVVPQLAELGDVVWYDSTRNDRQDAGELGVPGVTVELHRADGTLVSSQVTDATGNYLFTNLVPGGYYVVFNISTLPADYRFVSQDSGANDAIDSDANSLTGQTATTTLTAGESDLTWDAGIYELASIGDYVWLDRNDNGVQDASEPGVPSVTVNLLDNDHILVATTTTDATGHYLFPNLEPGDYTVEFVPPPGYTFTTPDSATDTTDSDANTSTGRTISTTLAPGEHDLSWDAGLIGNMSLGNLVWEDIDNNGRVNIGEPGIAGVTVRLYQDSNNDGVPDGAALATTTTDASGHYLFPNLVPDTYLVEVLPPAGYHSSTGTNGSATGPFEPAPDADNDVDNDDNGTTSAGSIRSAPVTLSPGAEPITDGDSDANSNLTVDFGLFQPASLGTTVWNDINKDGVKQSNEPGVPGITVTLYDSNGMPVATTTTDADGHYAFTTLVPGTYTVGFTNLPSGWGFTLQNQGDTTTDSDVDVGTGQTGAITLQPGENNPTIYAGITPPATTAITLTSFTATRDGAVILVRWATSAEVNTWGFLLYRSADGDRTHAVRVTAALIRAQGRGQGGASYIWTDTTIDSARTYSYWLEETDVDGYTHAYGPVVAKSPSIAATTAIFMPIFVR